MPSCCISSSSPIAPSRLPPRPHAVTCQLDGELEGRRNKTQKKKRKGSRGRKNNTYTQNTYRYTDTHTHISTGTKTRKHHHYESTQNNNLPPPIRSTRTTSDTFRGVTICHEHAMGPKPRDVVHRGQSRARCRACTVHRLT